MNTTNRPAFWITLILCLIAVAAAGAGWWLHERVVILAGEVPLMPRAEVTRSQSRIDKHADVFLHTLRTPVNPPKVAAWYADYYRGLGWNVARAEERLLEMTAPDRRLRMVLHAGARTNATITLRVQKRR